MASIELNIMQERELARLIEYERATCTVDGDMVYRCAFPYRHEDDLQMELIKQGALKAKSDSKRGTIVAITSDGYSYFPAKQAKQEEQLRQQQRDTRLIGLSALFSAAALVVGILIGHFI